MRLPSDRLRLAQRGLALFNRGDFDASLATFAPDHRWDTSRMVPDGRVYRGREEIREYWIDVLERWEDFRIEPDRWLEGDDCVVMLGRMIARGAGSGVPVETAWHQVFTFRGGERAIRCDNYSDTAEALAAAGLDEV